MADEELREDIAAARNRMETRIGANREIRRLMEHLWDGERVELMSAGLYGAGTGLVVLTDRRLLFVKDGWTKKTTEDFPIEKIASVQWSSGVLQGALIVFSSGNKAEIKNMGKKDGKQIADAIRGRISHGASNQAPEPEPAAPPTVAQPASKPGPLTATPEQSSPVELLEQLGKLHQAGVLTDEEFNKKKAEILGRM